MKRAIALLLALTALGAAGLVYAHRTVSASAGAVEMYETLLYGDRAAAEGVELRLDTHCAERRLNWNSTLSMGAENGLTTDFSFSPYGSRMRKNGEPMHYGQWYSYAYLSAQVNAYGEVRGELEGDEPLCAVILDVASRTEPAQERRETVYLRDYYEYFPMYGDVHLPPGVDSGTFKRVFEESFKIPVPEDWQLEVSATKNTAGGIVEYSACPAEGAGPELDCLCAVSQGAVLWLAVQKDFEEDGSYECPGADCLYYSKRSGKLTPVFEIPEDEQIMQMYVDRLDRLQLLVNKSGTLCLRVYGIQWQYDTQGEYDVQLECVQEAELMRLDGDEWAKRPLLGENFLLVTSSEGRFALAELTETGEYVPRLEGEIFEPGDEYLYSDSETVRLWDGERLVAASALYSGFSLGDEFTGVMVWVYDETGLAFCARYDCSQCIPEAVSWSYEVKSEPGQELSLR